MDNLRPILPRLLGFQLRPRNPKTDTYGRVGGSRPSGLDAAPPPPARMLQVGDRATIGGGTDSRSIVAFFFGKSDDQVTSPFSLCTLSLLRSRESRPAQLADPGTPAGFGS